jgi:diguanylate cyclase (GGDEF)-like protein
MIDPVLSDTLFDMIPFGVYVVDIKTYEIIYLNREFQEWHSSSVGNICFESIYGLDKPCNFCKIKHLVEESGIPSSKTFVFEIFNDYNDCWYQYQDKAIYWIDNQIVKYSVAVDITQLKETQNRLAEAHAQLAIKNRELQRLAVTDQLTKLKNRKRIDELFSSEIDKVKRYKHPFSIILIDVDHFKSVNDTYGHQTGDLVLVTLAEILKNSVRKTDTPGRWGGEEFIIICPETDLAGVISTAEHIRKKIESHHFETVEHKTASFGVTEYVEGDTQKTMIDRADKALYEAKANGRNRVVSKSG